jgi:hypothetical protein
MNSIRAKIEAAAIKQASEELDLLNQRKNSQEIQQ